jgi:hypothetical protein
VSFTFRCALIFVDTYAHTLLLEVISIFHYDSALFLHRTNRDIILLLLYVDDMIITGDDSTGILGLKWFLS